MQWMRRLLYGEPGFVRRFASVDRQRAAMASAWVDYTAGSETANEWSLHRVFDVAYNGAIGEQWLMILSLSAAAKSADPKVVGVVGAGPLEDFIGRFGDEAMDLIEPQLESNPTLLFALAGVWPRDDVRGRVTQALAAHRQERY
jgi:hypothetical protein